MKQFIFFFLIWLIFVGVVAEVGIWVTDTERFQHLAESGVTTYGKVIQKEPDNHGLIRYSYTVDGKGYTGSGGAGRGNPRFDEMQIGQELIVSYDTSAPEISIPGYPNMYLGNNYFLIFFCAILIPIFPMIVVVAVYVVFRQVKYGKTGP